MFYGIGPKWTSSLTPCRKASRRMRATTKPRRGLGDEHPCGGFKTFEYLPSCRRRRCSCLVPSGPRSGAASARSVPRSSSVLASSPTALVQADPLNQLNPKPADQVIASTSSAAAANRARAMASRESPARSHHAVKTSASIGTRTTSTPLRRTFRSICSVATRHISYSGGGLPPSTRLVRNASYCSGTYQGRPTRRGRSTGSSLKGSAVRPSIAGTAPWFEEVGKRHGYPAHSGTRAAPTLMSQLQQARRRQCQSP